MANKGFLEQKPGFATVAIHAGQDPDKWNSGAVVPPITLSAMFKQAPDGHTGYKYGRTGNPMRQTLEECLAAMEGAKYAYAYASGLGAITTILSLLNKGAHIVSMDDIYSGTDHILRQVLTRLGIDVTFADLTKPENIEKAMQENTKMVWLETPTNPNLKVIDIAETVKLIKKRGSDILVVVDNTFLTCYFQKPLDFGVDIVMYSLTKYMNGHSDVIMGAAVTNDEDLAERLNSLQIAMGIVPSPFDCYLVNRSLKTLSLRMERHRATSLKIAQWLEQHPNVIEVMHPELPSHKQHDIAKKQTYGHSGVFSFKHAGELEESKKLLGSLQVFILAVSLGGYESLAQIPSVMTHVIVSEKQLAEYGITDSLVRLSIGLEDAEDLIDDLDQAFKATFK